MGALQRFLSEDGGSTAIEYSLIAAVIGLGIILALGDVRDGFGNVTNAVANGLNGG
jgi:Flp pilus assembly pilin Flp